MSVVRTGQVANPCHLSQSAEMHLHSTYHTSLVSSWLKNQSRDNGPITCQDLILVSLLPHGRDLLNMLISPARL